jgi:hypothetical protein
MAGQYWVTFPDVADAAQARAGALIWGPQANPPPQVTTPIRQFLAGPFANRADAQKYKDAIGSLNPLPPGGTPIIGSSGRGLTQSIANANPLAGVAAIGDFFQRLTQAHTWVRIGEVVLGLALFVVGLAAVAGHTKAGKTATKIAAKAALI